MTFLFPSGAFIQIVLLCIITNWSWTHPTNTKISVTRFSLKCKHDLHCHMHYICYSPSTMKIDSRTAFTKKKGSCSIWFSKTEKWEDWYSLLVPFIYFVWSSNEHQMMVQNLFAVLVYCDFAVILVHQKPVKKENGIALLFNSQNEVHFYPKWGIVHKWRQNATGKGVEKVWVHSIARISKYYWVVFRKR